MIAPSISRSCAVSRRILATSLFSISRPIDLYERLFSKHESRACGHHVSCSLNIFQHLFAQGLRAGKLLLVAEALEEYYFHFAGGQLLGETEEVRFDGELVAVEGGTDADVCDGPVDS